MVWEIEERSISKALEKIEPSKGGSYAEFEDEDKWNSQSQLDLIKQTESEARKSEIENAQEDNFMLELKNKHYI